MDWKNRTNSVAPYVSVPNLGGDTFKEGIYTPTVPQNLYELKIRIRVSCESVHMQMLSSV